MEKSINELLAENSNLQDFYRGIINRVLNGGSKAASLVIEYNAEYRNKDSERIAKKREAIKEERPDTELKKEERKMNAVTARLLIWHYYSVDAPPDGYSLHIRNSYHFLIIKNFIKKDGNMHKLTEKGKVLVEYWLSTPLPIEQTEYLIPDRK